jgi:hypothetical protein
MAFTKAPVWLHRESNIEIIIVEPKCLTKFVDIRVAKPAEYRHYSMILSSHIKRVFLKYAEGTFIWVAVVARELRKYALTEVENIISQPRVYMAYILRY